MKNLILSLLLLIPMSGAPALAADAPRVAIQTTAGQLVLELYPSRAPETVQNFLRLIDQGFYRNLIFHRVVPGFVVQTGGYDEKLNYRKPPRSVVNESANGLSNRLGTVAMARLADPDSADTQFFINLNNNSHLDGSRARPGYAVFGRVVEGMDVVKGIEGKPTHLEGGMRNVPVERVVITSAKRL
ncbi:MAG: peptidylprolyl isomerase [Pseudomonadales bacterium]|jgi:cyclophilin family peptidyl-prolyl cis-trans isomerase|nr:peptidylprolyl isomerase [Pseudomonadales bacterium]MDP6472040.1 peptidylprolyl isomerase [Pseudomonadales bacterium]MDP6826687.1 peptidylprolyl isomerase [Pseudomonadales bacterium]MDP6969952.1 peptidylprolyl isomerase [Pseudomonadales bacterium]